MFPLNIVEHFLCAMRTGRLPHPKFPDANQSSVSWRNFRDSTKIVVIAALVFMEGVTKASAFYDKFYGNDELFIANAEVLYHLMF